MAKGDMTAYHDSMKKLCEQIEKFLTRYGKQDGTLDHGVGFSEILGEKPERYWDAWHIAIVTAFTIQKLHASGSTSDFDEDNLAWALAMRVTNHSNEVPEAFTIHAANVLHLNALAGLAKEAMKQERDGKQGVMYKTVQDVERWASNPEEALKVRRM